MLNTKQSYFSHSRILFTSPIQIKEFKYFDIILLFSEFSVLNDKFACIRLVF